MYRGSFLLCLFLRFFFLSLYLYWYANDWSNLLCILFLYNSKADNMICIQFECFVVRTEVCVSVLLACMANITTWAHTYETFIRPLSYRFNFPFIRIKSYQPKVLRINFPMNAAKHFVNLNKQIIREPVHFWMAILCHNMYEKHIIIFHNLCYGVRIASIWWVFPLPVCDSTTTFEFILFVWNV